MRRYLYALTFLGFAGVTPLAGVVNADNAVPKSPAKSTDKRQDEIRTRFRKGRNRILLKIVQGSGEWGFCVRVADAKGKAIDLRR